MCDRDTDTKSTSLIRVPSCLKLHQFHCLRDAVPRHFCDETYNVHPSALTFKNNLELYGNDDWTTDQVLSKGLGKVWVQTVISGFTVVHILCSLRLFWVTEGSYIAV